ncbi:MAG: cbb3-type cytochrome c oxidase subunit 3 [Melioribacteraceae bacterium]|jgi:cbb3-type cytochrome oxidase subunit 3|nr:cbb3-type cytochrome c oxidase subunit 3 [Melioribacteraceae bacterium]
MIRDNLSNIEGVSVFPIIALILFVLIFTLAIIWVFRLDKKYIKQMEIIPLDSNNEIQNNIEIKNEIN